MVRKALSGSAVCKDVSGSPQFCRARYPRMRRSGFASSQFEARRTPSVQRGCQFPGLYDIPAQEDEEFGLPFGILVTAAQIHSGSARATLLRAQSFD